jgi:hypothetical protein
MSCLVLELSVDPGGMRKSVYHVHKTMKEIKKALCKDFLSPMWGIYAAAWYGERMLLHVIKDGECIDTIDIHPYLTFKINTLPYIRFDEDNEMKYFDQNDKEITFNDDNIFGEKDNKIRRQISGQLFRYGNIQSEDQIDMSKKYDRLTVRGTEMSWNNRDILRTVEYDLDQEYSELKRDNAYFYEVTMDWGKIEIPELEGRKLWRNKTIEFDGMELRYGQNDLE